MSDKTPRTFSALIYIALGNSVKMNFAGIEKHVANNFAKICSEQHAKWGHLFDADTGRSVASFNSELLIIKSY